ncbi:MAG TPA: ATP-binding protein [Magnetospirillum sp.]|nr:ATP-binding protein [Magnetospirillum sp.]
MGNSIPPAIGRVDDVCEREPIHAPGCIQPHGALLCAERDDGLIVAASANAEALLSHAGTILGRHVNDLLPAHISVAINDLAATEGDGELERFLTATQFPPFGAAIHAVTHGDLLYVEVEKLEAEDLPDLGAQAKLNVLFEAMGKTETLDALADMAARAIREATGMERVLVYRFDEEGHGEVLAESRVDDWHDSFVGFHFPAADIPKQARTLYLTSQARFTPLRDHPLVPLIPNLNPRTGLPFDIGRCRLRSLSLIHRNYQENLGVDGAMSLSVIESGRLWGLIVGHHRGQHRVPLPGRQRAMALTRALAMCLNAAETAEERDARSYHVVMHARLLEQIAGADDFVTPLVDGEVKLTDIFYAASGAAVVYRDLQPDGEHIEVKTVGEAPHADDVVRLADACRANMSDGVFATDCLGGFLPEFARYAAEASGVLAISVGENGRHTIMWFRTEAVRTTVWGGATPGQVEAEKRAGNYLPRRSFARWVVERRGHSRPWPKWKIEIARSLRTALNDVILRQMRTIRMLNARLEESDRAKSRFLAHMSHELRTPLNAVIGFSEMLQHGIYGPVSARQQESLNCIHDAGAHLLSMINDILDLSKVEAGRMELHDSDVSVTEMVSRVSSLLLGVIREHDLSLAVQGPDDLVVRADERAVKQMLLNLLSNAVKFAHAGTAITVTRQLRADGGISLTVSDKGIGIPVDQLGRVLEPFRQAHDDTTRTQVGTGLGLPIVKGFMELHGGELVLTSVENEGTSVELRFPADRTLSPRP